METTTATEIEKKPDPTPPAAPAAPAPRPTGKKIQLVAGAPIHAIVPRSIEEAYRLANAIVRAGLAPRSYEFDKGLKDDKGKLLQGYDPEKVMIGIMKALEVGLPPITGLSFIAIINKRPCIWGDGAVALIQDSGLLHKMTIEEIGTPPATGAQIGQFPDDFGIKVTMWRVGQDEPYVGKFTVGDAKRAKLWMHAKKLPWIEYPIRQMKWRAFSWASRDGFADCLAGLMIREEVEDMPHDDPPAPIDTGFLEDGLTPRIMPPVEAEPEGDKPSDILNNDAPKTIVSTATEITRIPVHPLPEGGSDWPRFHREAIEHVGQAPSADYLVAWVQEHDAALKGVAVAKKQWRMEILDAVAKRTAELSKAAA